MRLSNVKNVAMDAVFDSVSIATTFKEELSKAGVIFCSISEAVREMPDLVRKHLGSVVRLPPLAPSILHRHVTNPRGTKYCVSKKRICGCEQCILISMRLACWSGYGDGLGKTSRVRRISVLQVPAADNYFAALNAAVFSDGSFVYVPAGVRCPMEVATYFRINAESSGQV